MESTAFLGARPNVSGSGLAPVATPIVLLSVLRFGLSFGSKTTSEFFTIKSTKLSISDLGEHKD